MEPDEIDARLNEAIEAAKAASHEKRLDPLMSSVEMGWETPENFLSVVRQMGEIALDPCTTDANPVGAVNILTPAVDGLSHMWALIASGGLIYMNSPYGRQIKEWTEKAKQEASHGAEIIALVPSRTDTDWWHRATRTTAAVCFWSGRLTFRGAKNAAPFPSAVLYWGDRAQVFRNVFEPHGWVVETFPETPDEE